MMMPIYPGAPWVLRFLGPGSEVSYGEWTIQLKGLLEVQDLTEPLKVSILMGALTGVAKRQISVITIGQRDTAAKIFAALDGRYTEKTPAPVLRSQLFSCVQKPDELVQDYVLRLQELHCRLLQLDPDGAPTNPHLREQFLLGLEEGPILQALKTYVRQKPGASFDEVQQEAALLEEDRHGRKCPEVMCSAVGGPNFSRSRSQEADWRQVLKREILEEVKEQIGDMTKKLLQELKPPMRAPSPAELHEHYPTTSHQPSTGRPRSASFSSNTWDERGRPICRRCNQAGHVARFCRGISGSTPNLN